MTLKTINLKTPLLDAKTQKYQNTYGTCKMPLK